ncbi:MAG: hypothetical protein E6Q61_08635, partial [Nitrosomonas sp.]
MSDRSNQVIDVIHPNRVTDDSVRVSTRVGILVRCYPKLSETFILGEILGLEKENIPLHIFSLFPPSDQLVNPAVNFVKASVTTLANGDSAMSMHIIKKSPQHIDKIRTSGQYLTELLQILYQQCAPGVGVMVSPARESSSVQVEPWSSSLSFFVKAKKKGKQNNMLR